MRRSAPILTSTTAAGCDRSPRPTSAPTSTRASPTGACRKSGGGGRRALGEDNDYVYKTILGVTDDEFEHYRKLKILAEDYLDPARRTVLNGSAR